MDKLLLEHDVDADVEDVNGLTPTAVAKQSSPMGMQLAFAWQQEMQKTRPPKPPPSQHPPTDHTVAAAILLLRDIVNSSPPSRSEGARPPLATGAATPRWGNGGSIVLHGVGHGRRGEEVEGGLGGSGSAERLRQPDRRSSRSSATSAPSAAAAATSATIFHGARAVASTQSSVHVRATTAAAGGTIAAAAGGGLTRARDGRKRCKEDGGKVEAAAASGWRRPASVLFLL
ncbi:hypothetical protein E2562_037881 [Oryza meyeriana var. granulata]|uniref:Uncharacterized protein n=1 Tax=Oryza meyeriana var. granulata TaxID=110450 RepID=A0A6G1DT75_9ORYZ|nr:hypothetical protein E2562_037881 [Oryza meyeriana var. granulata]